MNKYLGIFSLLLFVIQGCYNPFFPSTGLPDVDSSLRKTPSGVIKQLVNAYEGRRLEIYRDLFGPDGSFRYYIAPLAIDELELNNLRRIASAEVIKDNIPFIDSGSVYSYVSFSSELEIHRNMFLQADDITFTQTLGVDSVSYIVKSGMGSSDSSYQGLSSDTIAAIVKTREAEMSISADIFEQQTGSRVQVFDLRSQVFYLTRDPLDQSLWIITKWFEL